MVEPQKKRNKRRTEYRSDRHFLKLLPVFGEYWSQSIAPKAVCQLYSVHMSDQYDNFIRGDFSIMMSLMLEVNNEMVLHIYVARCQFSTLLPHDPVHRETAALRLDSELGPCH